MEGKWSKKKNQVGLSNSDKIELDQLKLVGFILEEALSLLLKLNLSKIKYCILRQALKQNNIYVFTSYNLLIEKKTKRFPTDIKFKIFEDSSIC